MANAGADDTVEVGPGTFAGTGQIVLNEDLTLSGAGADETVLRPGYNTGNSGDARGWFLVDATTNVAIEDLTLDGNAPTNAVFQAIRNKGELTIDAVGFENIVHTSSYSGTAIGALSGTVTDVNESIFSNIGRIGVNSFGTGSFTNNTYEGKGDGDHIDYALDIGGGGVFSDVSRNTVSDNTGEASSDGSVSAGFLFTTFAGAGTAGTLTDNDITDNTVGIHVGFNNADTSAVTATGNRIVGNDHGVVSTNPAVDAENNWWGCNGGPGAVGCDTVDGTVDSNPRLVLGLGADATEIETGGATSQVTAEIGANSAGQPVATDVFDGEDVVFATDRGMVQTPRTFAGTAATSTLTSGASAGAANVTGTYDNQTSGTEVTFVAPAADPVPGDDDGGGETPLPAPLPGPTNGADNLVGTDGDDLIKGLGGADTILGGLGNDLIKGGGGADVLDGGEGKDEVRGGKGADQVDGGEGNDVIRGGPSYFMQISARCALSFPTPRAEAP